MAISSAFQLSLEIFDLDLDAASARREIWRILQPRMERVVNQYIERLSSRTPFYRDLVTNKNELIKEQILNFTAALFQKPFDEQWEADTKHRVEEEIEFSLDVRNRCVISQIILAELCLEVGKHYRFSFSKSLSLLEVATRVLLMDTTNAVALHYNAAVREAKGRSNHLNSAMECFSQAIEGVRNTMSSAVAALHERSNELMSLAQHSAQMANKAALAADDTAANVNEMATATEQMMASIWEIRQQATTGATKAHEAVANAHRANDIMQSLSDNVDKIGAVTGLISDIAKQTNLLALNATIEAARAGQAGKGFAVVANEVKVLAGQTSSATHEISDQVGTIEEATRRSVAEIGGTGRVIANVAEMAEGMVAAVNGQVAAGDTISKGISGAAGNATTVASALKTVAKTVEQTQALAIALLEASHQLAERTRQMDAAVDGLFQAAARQNVNKIADLKRSISIEQVRIR